MGGTDSISVSAEHGHSASGMCCHDHQDVPRPLAVEHQTRDAAVALAGGCCCDDVAAEPSSAADAVQAATHPGATTASERACCSPPTPTPTAGAAGSRQALNLRAPAPGSTAPR